MSAAMKVRDTAGESLDAYLEEIGRRDLLTADEEIELAQAIEAGEKARTRLPKVSDPLERLALERAILRGDRARQRFLEANLRLVVSIAKRYRRSGIELLDLIQEGNLGLLRAVEKFEWQKGFKFSTYATWWIRQAVSKAAQGGGRAIRLPARLTETMPTIDQSAARFYATHGRNPTAEELADYSGVPLADVKEALAVQGSTSLEAPIGEDGATLGDFVVADGAEMPEEVASAASVSAALVTAINRLDERERTIMFERFGFVDDVPRARADIGEEFGVTAERIYQIERRALCKLRHPAFGLREEDLV